MGVPALTSFAVSQNRSASEAESSVSDDEQLVSSSMEDVVSDVSLDSCSLPSPCASLAVLSVTSFDLHLGLAHWSYVHRSPPPKPLPGLPPVHLDFPLISPPVSPRFLPWQGRGSLGGFSHMELSEGPAWKCLKLVRS